MYTAKVKVAFRWDVGDIGWDALFMTELVDDGASSWIIDCCHDHTDIWIVEIGFEEFAVMPCYCACFYSVADFWVQTLARGDDCDGCVGAKEVIDAAGCYLN